MIELTSKELSQNTLDHLKDRQQKVDVKPSFNEKRKRAKQLWDGKRGSIAGRAAFKEIKDSLLEMGVGVEICNYCENNEGTDIEHIFPKDWYPEKTFIWENYLLACRTCNTDYKNNRFAVITIEGTRIELEDQPEVNVQSAFIDPRSENPMNYFWLNLRRGIYTVHPNIINNSLKRGRAEYTRNLLGLNTRETLVKARQRAARAYLDQLEQYIRIISSASFNELRAAVDPLDVIDEQQGFETEQSRLAGAIQIRIKEMPHPTVWKELIRQRSNDDYQRVQTLFEQAPEALKW